MKDISAVLYATGYVFGLFPKSFSDAIGLLLNWSTETIQAFKFTRVVLCGMLMIIGMMIDWGLFAYSNKNETNKNEV